MLTPVLGKNDRKAKIIILGFSAIVFAAIILLSRVKLEVNLGFNVHWFARINAVINSAVSILLLAALIAIMQKKYLVHKNIMLTAMVLSMLFLASYICHHLFAGETKFGDANHDGIVDADELQAAGSLRSLYRFILLTHIPLAGIILPFILYTAYYSLTGDYNKHKRLARITWPVWFYVAITGVAVYVMISPYYS